MTEEKWKRLEQEAFEGIVDFAALPPGQYKYFRELTAVYHAFRFEGLDEQTAKARKAELLKEYKHYVAEYERAGQIIKDWNEAIKNADLAYIGCRQAESLQEMVKLLTAALGIITGDKLSAEVILKKAEGMA